MFLSAKLRKVLKSWPLDDKKLMKRRTSLWKGKQNKIKRALKRKKISKPSTVKHLNLATNNYKERFYGELGMTSSSSNLIQFLSNCIPCFLSLVRKGNVLCHIYSKRLFFFFIYFNPLSDN